MKHIRNKKEMEMDTKNLMEVCKEEGVRDLPRMVQINFARALVAERNGDLVQAEEYLKTACEYEVKSKAA
jgi:hypothetical protein